MENYSPERTPKRYMESLKDVQLSINGFKASIYDFTYGIALKLKEDQGNVELLQAKHWINNALTNLVEIQKNNQRKKRIFENASHNEDTELSSHLIVNQPENHSQNLIPASPPTSPPSLPWLSNQIQSKSKTKKMRK